jgi:heterodisulfide reductase subunit A
MRIGVFVCHCGTNIGGMVDSHQVAEAAKQFPHVAYATDYLYTCSEPGQLEIQTAIKEQSLDGVVVAACSPRMHENTFRRTVERAGLNRYMFEMANIREHCSWIGADKEANTRKAAELVSMAVAKVANNVHLHSSLFDVNKRVLVLGGGVAGMQAAFGLRRRWLGRDPRGEKNEHRREDVPARQDISHGGLLDLHLGSQDG